MVDVTIILYLFMAFLIILICLSWCCKHYYDRRRRINLIEFDLEMQNQNHNHLVNNMNNRRRLIRYLQMRPEILPIVDYPPYEIIDNNDMDKECIICMEKIGEQECKLHCGHGYHYNCIREWAYVRGNNNCPQCRGAIIDLDI